MPTPPAAPPAEPKPTVATRGIVLGQPLPVGNPLATPEPKPTVQTRGVVLGQPPPVASPVAASQPKATMAVRGVSLGAGPPGAAQPAAPAATTTAAISEPPEGTRGVGWDAWRYAGAMPRRIRVSGEVWDLVDAIDVRNPQSEESHGFEVMDAARLLREQGTFRYPSGGPLDGRGYRHYEGFVRFAVRNLIPYEPLALVRQVLASGEEHLSVRVGGVHVGDVDETERDERSPWRNRTTVVAPNRIVTPEVRVEVADEGSPDGVTWFAVWCYQPSPGA